MMHNLLLKNVFENFLESRDTKYLVTFSHIFQNYSIARNFNTVSRISKIREGNGEHVGGYEKWRANEWIPFDGGRASSPLILLIS